MADIRDKISKLLALADSPNENEAKSALLKARALLAQHKLTEADLRGLERQRVVYEETGVSCTAMTNAWAASLGTIIAQHYCCKAVRYRNHGAKLNKIKFIGLEEDFDIAKKIFLYAYDCVIAQCKRITREKKRLGWATPDIRKACNAYGNGFCLGVKQAYEEQQQKHQEWGLVMVTPKPVNDYMSKMNLARTRFGSSDERRMAAFRAAGFEAGKKFSPNYRIH